MEATQVSRLMKDKQSVARPHNRVLFSESTKEVLRQLALWMDPEDTMLSDVGQTEGDGLQPAYLQCQSSQTVKTESTSGGANRWGEAGVSVREWGMVSV